MTIQDDMAQIEARVVGHGKTVSQLCVSADIARSTWDRWKRGETEPNLRTWRSITAAAEALCRHTTPSEDAA